MEIVVLGSARRHGIADADILHVFENAVFVHEAADDDLTMLVGPQRNSVLIEIGVVVRSGTVFVVHAMVPARDKYLR